MTEPTADQLLKWGKAALAAGDDVEARMLFGRAVQIDQGYAEAWFELAQVANDIRQRKHCLQMVVKLDPDNIEAKLLLAKATSEFRRVQVKPAAQAETFQPSLPTSPDVERESLFSSHTAQVTSPLKPRIIGAIPGAPEQFTTNDLLAFVVQMLQEGTQTLMGKPASTTVTWWRYVLTIFSVSFLSGGLLAIGGVILAIQLSATPRIGALITTPFATLLTGSVAITAGCVLAHWYLSAQHDVEVSLLDYSYVLARIWAVPTLLITGVMMLQGISEGTRVFTINDALVVGVPQMSVSSWGITAITAFITLYTVYIMGRQTQIRYQVKPHISWVAALIVVTVTALVF